MVFFCVIGQNAKFQKMVFVTLQLRTLFYVKFFVSNFNLKLPNMKNA